MKACPFCAEQIQDAAIKCRCCGSMLATAPTSAAVDGLKVCATCGTQVSQVDDYCWKCLSEKFDTAPARGTSSGVSEMGDRIAEHPKTPAGKSTNTPSRIRVWA